MTSVSRDKYRGSGQPALLKAANAEVEFYQREQAKLDREVKALTVRAPRDGIMMGRDLRNLLGVYLARGRAIGEIADAGPFVATIVVSEDEIADVAADALARIRLSALPRRVLEGTVTRVAPRVSEVVPEGLRDVDGGQIQTYRSAVRPGLARLPLFDVTVPLPPSEAHLLAGMTGRARIRGRRRPLLFQWGRTVTRVLRQKIWL